MALKVLTAPPTEGLSISGALIYFTIPLPLQDFPVTESQVNSLAVLLCIFWMCRYLTHGLEDRPGMKRHVLAEWVVEQTDNLIKGNMGEYFKAFSPFIGAILALSALSSLSSLLGLYPPTSDLNIVAGWAILVFGLITYYKMKCGPVHYAKSFSEPIALMTPMNVISEIATPISMAFRHYGNVLSGSVISALIANALGGLSNTLLGWIPLIGEIPLLRIGLPAILSVYFDLFSGGLQAFIFATLTMLYIAGGFPADDYAKRKLEKEAKKKNKAK
ncbi:MAG: F0F1 ATP synthase subunit A, partial [Lachnospiraceae bacterium]|nr:F0F1 ATP synthase subunit A [Lachnospiraceae bacterium]